jgi:DNA-binding transcriptional MerR regulator
VANLLNIAALSRRTGVAPDTLRKWEQRYGILRPAGAEGGQRRYTEHDAARVEWLRDRLAEGWRIGEAARVLEEPEGPPCDDPAEQG